MSLSVDKNVKKTTEVNEEGKIIENIVTIEYQYENDKGCISECHRNVDYCLKEDDRSSNSCKSKKSKK